MVLGYLAYSPYIRLFIENLKMGSVLHLMFLDSLATISSYREGTYRSVSREIAMDHVIKWVFFERTVTSYAKEGKTKVSENGLQSCLISWGKG